MFQKILQRKFHFLLAIVIVALLAVLPSTALAAPLVPVPAACPTCGSTTDFTSSGDMGTITPANTPSLGTTIAGAPWSFCSNCNTIVVGGGGLQFPNNTNIGNQSRFLNPGGLDLSLVEQVVFTAPITAGSSMHDLFHDMTNLTTITNIEVIDTTATQNFRRMFFNTTNLTGPLDLSGWNTPAATNMYRMFSHSGIDILNLGGSFNAGGLVTNFGSMFWNASNLVTVGDVSAWEMGSATRMSRMFQGASSLTDLNPSSWDTSSVILMYNMFNHASSLTTLDLSQWDVSGVTRMDNMFSHATSLADLDLSGWSTNSLERMDNMFDGATSLTRLDLSGFITGDVGNRNHAFRGAPLQELITGPGWHWTATNPLGLINPPSNATYTGLWVRVGSGETATSLELFDNSLYASGEIIGTWVWQRHVTVHFVSAGNGVVTPGSTATTSWSIIDSALPIYPAPNLGYRLLHWTSSDPNHAGGPFQTHELHSLLIAQDTTFTAHFGPLPPNTHMVTFLLNGGYVGSSPDPRMVTVTEGSAITEANTPVPTRADYIFLGWRENNAGDTMNRAEVAALIVMAPRSFTAQWQPVAVGGGENPPPPVQPETPRPPDNDSTPPPSSGDDTPNRSSATGPKTGDVSQVQWMTLLVSGLAVIVVASSLLEIRVRDSRGIRGKRNSPTT